ncbi:MAG: hypothetical protein WEB05_02410 [Solirubrobacterales bacterium]
MRRAIAVSVLAIVAMAMSATAVPTTALSAIPGQFYALSDVRGAQGDLFRTTRTGSSWVRLTSGLSFPESVSASPDGKFAVICAAARGGDSAYRVYRVEAAGGALRNLIGNRQGCGQTVSPDGKKVAYVGAGNGTLNIVRSQSGGHRTIYRFCGGCIYNPVWANGRIYFERRVTRNSSADREIYSVRARDGRGLKRHTNDGGAEVDYTLADVSRNGRKLLLLEQEFDPLISVVFYGLSTYGLSPAGDTPPEQRIRYLTEADALTDASFAPSGNSIAYVQQGDTSLGDPLYGLKIIEPLALPFSFSRPSVSSLGTYSIDWVSR